MLLGVALLFCLAWFYGGLEAHVFRSMMPRSRASPPPVEARRTVVLVGGTGSGKSETGNTILDRRVFNVSARQRTETRHLQQGSIVHQGKEYIVYDTPGWCGAGMQWDDAVAALEELAKNSENGMDAAGVDAFLLVLPYGRLDDQAMQVYETFKRVFGDDAIKHTILVYTKAGALTSAEIVEEMADICEEDASCNQCKLLQELASPDRVLAIGELTPKRRRADRYQLLEQVEAVAADNEGVPYDHEIFSRKRAARAALRERVDRLGTVGGIFLNRDEWEMLLQMRTDDELEVIVAAAESEVAKMEEERGRREAEAKKQQHMQEEARKQQQEERLRRARAREAQEQQAQQAEQQRQARAREAEEQQAREAEYNWRRERQVATTEEAEDGALWQLFALLAAAAVAALAAASRSWK